MGHPEWLYYLFGLAMMVVAAYSVVLLRLSIGSADRPGRDVDVAHFAMGITMAGMFVPDWAFWPHWFWEVVFLVLTVWFVVRTAQSLLRFGVHVPHEGIHATMSFAMLLMYLFPMGASSSAMSMSMSSSSSAILDPGVSFVLAVTFFGSAIFTLASPNKGASHHGTHRRHNLAYAALGAPPPAIAAGPRTRDRASAGMRILTSPRTEDLSHVVMCLSMGFMLILMI